mgnify:CR=1 FL=1
MIALFLIGIGTLGSLFLWSGFRDLSQYTIIIEGIRSLADNPVSQPLEIHHQGQRLGAADQQEIGNTECMFISALPAAPVRPPQHQAKEDGAD